MALLLASDLSAVNLKDTALVDERMLVLNLTDSRVQLSMPGHPIEEKVVVTPLDLGRALDPKAWRLSSPGKPDFSPLKVGRKSKGRDYLMHLNPWRIDHGMEHFLYLELPQALKPGTEYRLSGGVLDIPITLDPATARSESIHVNQVGYRPGAVKRGFLSQWAGDLGAVDFAAWTGKPFELIDLSNNKSVFKGSVTFCKRAEDPDSGQAKEGNHLASGLWVADFSAFKVPGRYVLSIPGIGRSYPFEINAGVYRKAFQTAMRGLYHQRCGTALKKPWGVYERAACHAPNTGKILQSSIRRMDRQCDACQDVGSTGEVRDIAGGWHDAGDWDREPWHLFVPMVLCLAYEMAPGNFKDGELLIPESGNGLPDILDEAQWGLDYWRRLQRPSGGVSVGLFLDKFPQPGQGAEDGDGKRYLYAEDPQASYRYAAAACHFAFALQKAGRGTQAPAWIASARKAYAWAEKNQRPGDFAIVRDDRLHASACLFHATQETVFHEAFKKDLLI
ncbi:MAG: glycoside hydrolase family 9 protein, partial [candidate division FCPU426 bacterium]